VFNALGNLMDEIPDPENEPRADTEESIPADAPDTGDTVAEPASEPEELDDADEATVDQPGPSLEFDAPAKTWSSFFIGDDSSFKREHPESPGEPLEEGTGDAQEWQDLLSEVSDNLIEEPVVRIGAEETDYEDDDSAISSATSDDSSFTATRFDRHDIDESDPISFEPDAFNEPARVSESVFEAGAESGAGDYLDPGPDIHEAPELVLPSEAGAPPPWIGGENEDALSTNESSTERQSKQVFFVFLLLLVALLAQFLHYNRDSLATHPRYGEAVRSFYSRLGSKLYPEWDIDAFRVGGTEVIAGRTAPLALDILANVEVVGGDTIGMPLIRVVLSDRWSNPVASRVFFPAEYLIGTAEPGITIPPETIIPVEISVADPGTDAHGYVVDVCLPNRSEGLQCQQARKPFK